MTTPFMTECLIFIPKAISYIALIGLMIAGIQEFRQGHIGRVGIAANAFLLWQIFYGEWLKLPNWFQWYLNIGTIFAVVAILWYPELSSSPLNISVFFINSPFERPERKP